MKQLVIGIDGGGTKTEAVVMDCTREIVLQLTGESTNPHSVTFPVAMRNLGLLLDTIRASLDASYGKDWAWSSVTLGLSGISTLDEQTIVYRWVEGYKEERDISFVCSLRNDAQIALMATLQREAGIIAISGTGSIIYGLSQDGEQHRAGGWGHILGDEGSGYDIGLRTLKTVMRCYDGIIPPTLLTSLVIERHGFSSLTELKPYIYRDSIHKSDIAKFAELAVTAARQGDSAAHHIIETAAQNLAATALALIGKHPWFASCDLVLTGSIFTHSEAFNLTFREAIRVKYPEIMFHNAAHTPAYGAALLALKHHSEQLYLKESD